MNCINGEHGEHHRELRRIGITFSFTFTYLCQLMFTSCLLQTSERSKNLKFAQITNILLLFLGVLSLALDVLIEEEYDRIENGFEWSFALLMSIHALFIANEWKQKRYQIRFFQE